MDAVMQHNCEEELDTIARVTSPVYRIYVDCPLCGEERETRKCKIFCPNCGYTEDCGDLR